MAEYKNGLQHVPQHMHESIAMWIELGEPHPSVMGSFLRAVLQNQLIEAFSHADLPNLVSMYGWALFLYNDFPSNARGTMDQMVKWWEHRGQKHEART